MKYLEVRIEEIGEGFKVKMISEKLSTFEIVGLLEMAKNSAFKEDVTEVTQDEGRWRDLS